MKKTELTKIIKEEITSLLKENMINMNRGYIEALGPDFDKGVKLILKSFSTWLEGPETKKEDIVDCKNAIFDFLQNKLKK